jgi:glycopeptide antibiotics resistance protein
MPAAIRDRKLSRRVVIPLCFILPIVALIALSCTVHAGTWCDKRFKAMFDLLLGSLGPSQDVFWRLHFIAEKSFHLGMFTILGSVLCMAFRRSARRGAWVLLIGFAIGCSSELLQRLFPTRDPAIRDVLINWTGVLIGLLVTRRFFPDANEFREAIR